MPAGDIQTYSGHFYISIVSLIFKFQKLSIFLFPQFSISLAFRYFWKVIIFFGVAKALQIMCATDVLKFGVSISGG